MNLSFEANAVAPLLSAYVSVFAHQLHETGSQPLQPVDGPTTLSPMPLHPYCLHVILCLRS